MYWLILVNWFKCWRFCLKCQWINYSARKFIPEGTKQLSWVKGMQLNWNVCRGIIKGQQVPDQHLHQPCWKNYILIITQKFWSKKRQLGQRGKVVFILGVSTYWHEYFKWDLDGLMNRGCPQGICLKYQYGSPYNGRIKKSSQSTGLCIKSEDRLTSLSLGLLL